MSVTFSTIFFLLASNLPTKFRLGGKIDFQKFNAKKHQ